MKLKLDENGNAVVQEGKPVYVHDDGQEIAFDAPQAMQKISDLNKESRDHRLKARKLEESMGAFEGIEDLETWRKDAEKALQTVQNLDESKLVDAGKVDALKKQLVEGFEAEKQTMTETISGYERELYSLLVSSQFASSPLLSEQTILPPDIAEVYFGKHFKVESHNGARRVVGYLGDDPIYSRQKPGELAGFEEAISIILENYPHKNKILKSGGSGTGSPAPGGSNPNPGKDRAPKTAAEKAAFISKYGLAEYKKMVRQGE